uniref:DUF1737 domain-containing protein n=1 Tax=viral metagenome TaxID=1070528 RepID=A0A6C0BC29_9ZZZZ
MPQYMIVNARGHEDMEKRVNKYLEKGWQLQGGISVTLHHSHTTTMQINERGIQETLTGPGTGKLQATGAFLYTQAVFWPDDSPPPQDPGGNAQGGGRRKTRRNH